MSVDEARRQLLHDAAKEAWGAEAAIVLMEMLPPTGWADVATKRDLDALRFEIVAQVADGQRRMMQWTVATMIAMTGVTTAVATAIARLG